MKKNILGVVLFGVVAAFILIIGCSTQESTQRKKDIVIDGVRYSLVREAHTNENGIVDAPLYYKEGITNKYYTPSIDNKWMNPLMK